MARFDIFHGFKFRIAASVSCACCVIYFCYWYFSLEKKAMDGDLSAMNRLATVYYSSDDSILHNVKSIEWMEKAAYAGDYRSKKTYLVFVKKIRCGDSLEVQRAAGLLLLDKRITNLDSSWVVEQRNKDCR